jgi:D-alanyl-D-alanine carboxypeptidase
MLSRVSLAAVALGCALLSIIGGSGAETARNQESARDTAAATTEAMAGSSPTMTAEVDSLFGPLVLQNMVSGSVLIAKRDEVLVLASYGLADREHGAPNTADTPFRIASVSKAVTATAVLRLVDDGKLELDATLDSFIPGFANGDRITIRQLLGQRSGIPSDVYLPRYAEESVQSLTLADAIAWARSESHPRFEPGARFDYSNTNYVLLTAIIEKAGGMPYAQYLARHVFGPAGMTSSGLDSADRILQGRAKGYSRSEQGEVINTAYRYPSFGWGCGALYSTVRDLLRFDRALVDGRLLSHASLDSMWSPRSDTPWGDHYGMGWFVGDRDGHGSVTALGSTGGFIAILRHFPAEDIVVVALLNQDFMLYTELFDRLSAIALGTPWNPMFTESSDAVERLRVFAGRYEMEDGSIRELRGVNGQLEFGDPGSGDFFHVFAVSGTEGYVAEQNARLRFQDTDEGEIKLVALYGNLAWRGRRVR